MCGAAVLVPFPGRAEEADFEDLLISVLGSVIPTFLHFKSDSKQLWQWERFAPFLIFPWYLRIGISVDDTRGFLYLVLMDVAIRYELGKACLDRRHGVKYPCA